MSSAAIRGFGASLARHTVETPTDNRSRAAAAELRVLGAGQDTVRPIEDDNIDLVSIARGAAAAGDVMRLPPPPSPGRHVAAAASRLLAADTALASPDAKSLAKEARLRHALRAIERVVDFVQIEANRERHS